MELLRVGITTYQESTWGRVYVDYQDADGNVKFIFRNYLKFVKKNFSGFGTFNSEPAFTWFNEQEITADYEAVLEGEYDFMYLTPANHKTKYGTPSELLRSLITDLDEGLMESIDKRRGWFKK
jgi:hypothetical protein